MKKNILVFLHSDGQYIHTIILEYLCYKEINSPTLPPNSALPNNDKYLLAMRKIMAINAQIV